VGALGRAGAAAAGATLVVTLEPCDHHGRTGPCTQAVIAAGISRVVFGQTDPNPLAAGGGERLRSAGIEVVGGLRAAEAQALNEVWSAAMALRRPWVTWKVAASLDGRIAAADGQSQWITGTQAREEVHQQRTRVDAVMTSTATALADRSRLTARPAGKLAAEQPLRVVVGHRELPADHPLADALIVRDHDPTRVLNLLWDREVRHVMLECGPRMAGAFMSAGLIDAITWYAAPLLLGPQGTPVLADGPPSLAEAPRWHIVDQRPVGEDLRIDLVRTED